jgi:hypothetical protein
MPIRAIEIGFAEPVELTQKDQEALVEIAGKMCERYERANPERVMWPAGVGQKMLTNPFMASDDEPLAFDETVFQIDCAERESYDDPAPDIKEYLERMDDRLLARDGSAELSHEDAKKALRNCYLIASGKQPEFDIK